MQHRPRGGLWPATQALPAAAAPNFWLRVPPVPAHPAYHAGPRPHDGATIPLPPHGRLCRVGRSQAPIKPGWQRIFALLAAADQFSMGRSDTTAPPKRWDGTGAEPRQTAAQLPATEPGVLATAAGNIARTVRKPADSSRRRKLHDSNAQIGSEVPRTGSSTLTRPSTVAARTSTPPSPNLAAQAVGEVTRFVHGSRTSYRPDRCSAFADATQNLVDHRMTPRAGAARPLPPHSPPCATCCRPSASGGAGGVLVIAGVITDAVSVACRRGSTT